MYLVFTLLSCITISFVFSLIARKLKLSVVIGLILAGIIIGSPFLKDSILGSNQEIVVFLGKIGFVFLLFLAGLEVSWSTLYQERREAAVIAFFAWLFPAVLGFSVFYLLKFPFSVSLIVAVCMSITAEATKVRQLLEMGKIKTKLGSLLLGAGILDDILGMASFVLIAYLLTQNFISEQIVLLFLAIAAFFAGVFVHQKFDRFFSKGLEYFEKGVLVLIVPFFFVSMGISFSLEALSPNLWVVFLIVALALFGKIGGVLLTKPFLNLPLKKLYIIGWGMNSRGAVELALAFAGFELGLLPRDVYSGLVIMAVVTTLIFPLFFVSHVRKNPAAAD